jgi:hypothetical protein
MEQARYKHNKTIEQIFMDSDVIEKFSYMLKYRTYHPEECVKRVCELADFITEKYNIEFESYC